MLKQLIARQVRAIFDEGKGETRRVARRSDGLFGPASMAWRVHGDVTTMLVGGVAALLMQMLHPRVLAGVWDHSSFRADLHGRLRRTARFIAVTTYGSRAEAEAMIARVCRVHSAIEGSTADGQAYHAQDPELLRWVHATEASCFLDAWVRYAAPFTSRPEQDRYFREVAVVAGKLGADEVPLSHRDTRDYINGMRPQLRADARTAEIARLVLTPPQHAAAILPFEMITRAAIDLLPGWARRMHGLPDAGLAAPLLTAGTATVARTVRWALA
ncbi:oxygenase MpaB family protein [Sphingobium sp. DEHP117]|uniref:oxygenase MpaB family protein n=1 Tax=Sphingobium sp. DEHP117 TaxID=2993436 RepID=UPI0027D957CF|nr:oxygenase MpaB family protein [Sphingobium sp. DEHP117]